MSTTDMGESLVGAYLRHVEGCTVVTYNSFFADRQGEVDVIGIKPVADRRREVYLCEVTTHTQGMLIVSGGKNATERKVSDKLARLRDFAELTFPGDDHRFQWWSPRVGQRAVEGFFAQVKAEWTDQGRSIDWVFNDEYTRRIDQLVASARANSSTTNEPAYRMLQILTRLRGERPLL